MFCNNDQDKSREQTREQRILDWYFRLNRLHRKVVEQELSTTGVYRSQHRILMCLAKNPHISQTELAERFHLSNRGFVKEAAAGRIYPEGTGPEGQPLQPDLHYGKGAESGRREPEYLPEN